MHRREALKKLATGGAVAVGTSAVLSSNNVAFAASMGDTGLVPDSIPGPGDPLPTVHSPSNNNRRINLSDSVSPQCSSGTATALYGWTIISYNMPGFGKLLIRNTASRQVIVRGVTGSGNYTALNAADAAVTLTRTGLPRKLTNATWSIGVEVQWSCSGHSDVVVAEYRLDGSINGVTVTNESWNVT